MSQDVQRHLRLALRMMLKPLVKLLINQGVTHADFAEAAKEVYVEVAIRHFMIDGKINQSRVAVLTGLTRKEVKRVLVDAQSAEYHEKSFSRPSRLLTAWHSDPSFIGPYGVPLDLRYDSEQEGERTFKQLVKVYGADMSPKAMLDILTGSGAIIEVEQNLYRVVRRGFHPAALSPELIERFGFVAHDFFSTAARNIEKTSSRDALLERVVRSSRRLSPAAIERLTIYLKENGQLFLEKIDNWIVGLEDEDCEEDKVVTGLGMYHYVESPEDKTSLRDLLVKRGLEVEKE